MRRVVVSYSYSSVIVGRQPLLRFFFLLPVGLEKPPQDRFWYLIYEHMPGGTLTEHLGTGRQFTEGEAKAMASR